MTATSSAPRVDPPELRTYLDPLRDRLRRETPRKIPKARLFEIWREVMPGHVGSLSSPDALLDALEALKAERFLSLPNKGHREAWDRSFRRAFPLHVRVAPAPREAVPSPADVVWHPLLDAFVASDPRSSRLRRALVLNDWLKAHSGGAPVVPVRERSWDVFGDETVLEKDAADREAGILYAEGPVTFADVSCEVPEVALQAVERPGPPGRPHLVVANHQTWLTVSRWNETAGTYARVLFGAGSQAPASASYVARRAGGDPVEYLCDLGSGAIGVLEAFAARVAKAGGGEVTFPAWAARIMLEEGRRKGVVADGGGTAPGERPAWASGMDPETADAVLALVRSGGRIPSEAIRAEGIVTGAAADPQDGLTPP